MEKFKKYLRVPVIIMLVFLLLTLSSFRSDVIIKNFASVFKKLDMNLAPISFFVSATILLCALLYLAILLYKGKDREEIKFRKRLKQLEKLKKI